MSRIETCRRGRNLAGFTIIEALGRTRGRCRLACGNRLGDRGVDAWSAGARAAVALLQTARAIETGLPGRDQLTIGSFGGEIAGHRWRVGVAPFAVGGTNDSQWVPQLVTTRVQSPSGAVIELNTVRIRLESQAMTWLSSHRRNAISGFTLVEALAAMVLMGLVLAALATITGQWLPNWSRGFSRVQSSQLLAAALDRIVADLGAAEFVSLSGDNRSRCSRGRSGP